MQKSYLGSRSFVVRNALACWKWRQSKCFQGPMAPPFEIVSFCGKPTRIHRRAACVWSRCISGEYFEDELIWHHNKDGMFMVKSASHTMLNYITQEAVAGTSNPQVSKNLWMKVWRA